MRRLKDIAKRTKPQVGSTTLAGHAPLDEGARTSATRPDDSKTTEMPEAERRRILESERPQDAEKSEDEPAKRPSMIPTERVTEIVRTALKTALKDSLEKTKNAAVREAKEALEPRIRELETGMKSAAAKAKEIEGKLAKVVTDTVGTEELDAVNELVQSLSTYLEQLIGPDGERINGMLLNYRETVLTQIMLVMKSTEGTETEDKLQGLVAEMGGETVMECLTELADRRDTVLDVLSEITLKMPYEDLSDPRYESHRQKIEEEGSAIQNRIAKIVQEAEVEE